MDRFNPRPDRRQWKGLLTDKTMTVKPRPTRVHHKGQSPVGRAQILDSPAKVAVMIALGATCSAVRGCSH